ncbi:putative protein N(5)-glutamine methyltransferase [Pseudarthrobacter sp. NS4]|uniref:putative protein N(5)-glutamine methyltransferase n=1 Tax=Pseudarthrobacter sp. NS4 TaxID=2973976 RepID=UPI0021613B54|nr:putative protein N(5)-glutamine methyltransferase [Pseudarthrobacter sp. NS4]
MPVPESPTASLTFAAVASTLRSAGCVFAEEEAQLLFAEASGPAQLADCVRRRAAGLPLEYILGWAEFAGRRIKVGPGVFVPRRRTELLVKEAASILNAAGVSASAVVLDLCCGSGAVVAIRSMPPEARLHESRLSLDGGTDGLDVHGRVAAAARKWLDPAGHVLIETSGQQAAGTASVLSAAGFAVRTARSEQLDGTVVVGTVVAGTEPR